ncbi:MAG: ATP synthase F0 subunit B [Patescibacteria group bacterium]
MEVLEVFGIDGWAVLMYLVNFGLLLAILTRFLYKPLLRYLDERRETVRKSIEEAETLRHVLADEREKREAEFRLLAAEAARQLAASKSEAESKSRAMLAETEARREKLLALAEAEIADQKRKLVGRVEADLLKRVEAVAMAALRDLPAETVRTSVSKAWYEASADL